ncbi:MAG: polyphosphate kinase 2 [Epsilonproteobacteria bacterium]|nr:polyphosphate kinase 2 [Campylobacterota bacterium]
MEFNMNQSLEEENKALKEEIEALKADKTKALRDYREAQELEPYQAELIKLQQHIELHDKKLMILFEGRDAAGKGSMIGTVSRYMNPKHYRIVALGRPTEEQKTQWYFQKYVEHFPSAGEVVLFDRSWYNRAMVEPVFGFCSPREHDMFMEDVEGFEKSLTDHDVVLIKLYLSVDKKEQARRFEKRKTDPLRMWKLSEIDLQSQAMWDDFTRMKHKMLTLTHHKDAPWYVIRSSNKHIARVEAMKLILNHFEYENKNMDLSYVYDEDLVVPVSEELALIERNHPYLKDKDYNLEN